jgi:transposase
MRKTTKILAENQKVFVGLEDSKRTWKLNVRCGERCIAKVSMPTDYSHLIRYLRTHYPKCDIRVIYEAGFQGFWLHDLLEGDGIGCIVTPPHLVTEQKSNRVKTDKVDAARLAKVLEKNDYGACHVPSPKRREDRQVSRTLLGVQRDIVRTMNRMRKFLDFHGIKVPLPSGAWGKAAYRQAMAMEFGGSLGIAWKVLVELLQYLQAQKKDLRKVLSCLAKEAEYREAVKVYSSAPGIAWFTAIRLALEWGDLGRFHTGKEFSSFLGLVCSEDSSGDKIRRGRITGQGNGFVRSWLIEASWKAISRDPVLRKKFQDVWLHSGSKKKGIVAVARKLAVRLHALHRSGETYQLGVIQ